MMFPNKSEYEQLYARFITGGTQPDTFLRLVGPVEGKAALDLCSGGGMMTKALLAAGANPVVQVDVTEKMLDWQLRRDPKVRTIVLPVKEALYKLYDHGSLFDAVFCRQGVNYWLDYPAVVALHRIMRPGAEFIFNTFADCPTEEPLVKEYSIGPAHYVEVSWSKLVGNVIARVRRVSHIQCCSGMDPHVTEFDFIPAELLYDIFRELFDLRIHKTGKTLIGIAKRK